MAKKSAAQNDLFAPPTDEELFAPPSKEEMSGGDDLFAPPSKDELGGHQEKGLLRSGLDLVGDIASGAGAVVDYFDAPIRQALDAPNKVMKGEKSVGDALLDIPAQFFQGPSNAPTNTEIAARYGISTQRQKVPPIVATHPLYEMNADNIIPEDEKVELLSPAEQAGGYLDLATGGLGLGAVAKGAGKAINSFRAPMKTASEALAMKQAGGMLGDFRKVEKKGLLSDIGQTLLKEKVSLPDGNGKLKEVPLMRFGDSVERIADKSEAKLKQVGNTLGSIYKQIDAKTADGMVVNSPVQRFDPANDMTAIKQLIEEKYGSKLGGENVTTKLEPYLAQIAKRDNSLQTTQKTLGELQQLVNFDKDIRDLPAIKQALNDVRAFIREKQNAYVESVADVLGVDKGKDVRKLNKSFQIMSEIEDMATDKVQRNRSNRLNSPTDYLSGAAGYMAMGPKGLLAAPANYVARTRGPGVAAHIADFIAPHEKNIGLLESKTALTPAAVLENHGAPLPDDLNREVIRNRIKKKAQ